MFLLREARLSDLDAIFSLAVYLDSPNLPRDRRFLAERLERSTAAFATECRPSATREYQLVLVDADDTVIGTSALLAKHGTPGLPHVYLEVREEEREAKSISVQMTHCTLQLGSTEDGPTEIGALVLHPDLRAHPEKPGKLLSWGRLGFVALAPARFESELLAEMRASLSPDGRYAFWEAFGKRFTGLSYAEADRRSVTDKTFILDLFPDTPFYASLLPEAVAEQLGQVHPEARPALRLLERAGFHWIGQIDPFDAGPFYGASQSEIVPIREAKTGKVAEGGDDAGELAMVMTRQGGAFRAVASPAEVRDGEIAIPAEARARLGLALGDEVWRSPLPASSVRRPRVEAEAQS